MAFARTIAGMYIIAIAWLYITVLMAATEPNITAGILTFALYGLAPLALFLWLFGTPQRRRSARQAAQNSAQNSAREAVDDVVGEDDGADARRDQ